MAIGVLHMTTISSVPETNASGLNAASASPPVTGALPGPRSADLLAHLACRESNARISAAPAPSRSAAGCLGPDCRQACWGDARGRRPLRFSTARWATR